MNYNFIYLLTIPIQPGFCLKVLIPVTTDMLNMKLHVLVNVLITIIILNNIHILIHVQIAPFSYWPCHASDSTCVYIYFEIFKNEFHFT